MSIGDLKETERMVLNLNVQTRLENDQLEINFKVLKILAVETTSDGA